MRQSRVAGYLLLSLYPVLFISLLIHENMACGWHRGLWQDAVCKSPHSARAQMNLAKAYQDRGRTTEAVEHYQAAMNISVAHHDFQSRDILAIAQSNLGVIFQQNGDSRSAELAYRGALSLIPGSGPASINLSSLLIGQKRYPEAITIIDDALMRRNFGPAFHADWKLYQNKGIALTFLGYCPQANENFAKAYALDFDRHPQMACN